MGKFEINFKEFLPKQIYWHLYKKKIIFQILLTIIVELYTLIKKNWEQQCLFSFIAII